MEDDLSPAERFARAKQNRANPALESFLKLLNFPLDDFQEKACRALLAGHGVLVAAPTGAGKTVVGEFAIHLADQSNQKVFYTTPIKALSNQKYQELLARYGKERVGLLTGDTNINSDAQFLVMTTEVLRNMIYASSQSLINLGFVVMDEVHYLADRFRGAVWEEVILHLPKDVKVVSLSATVSNAEEFGAWLDEVRGDTTVIVSETRPVPLNQHVLFGDELIPLFDDNKKDIRVNVDLVQRHANKMRAPGARPIRGRRGYQGIDRNMGRIVRISKPEVIDILEDADLLPAIFFIFSRAGCEAAVQSVLASGMRLTKPEDKQLIRRIAEEKCGNIPDEDLAALGYFEWLSALERGVAAHHAGLLPAFKEVVEELFLRKLVKVVFATETLALGINMPARTVVLERLDKFNGEGRVQITSGEYTQLTGRAGRRGIDLEGHSVIQWSGNLDPSYVASLASKRTYPLISSFRPTFNMAVNLIDAFGPKRSREVLETSFAQFQADRSVVGLARGIREKQASLRGYEDSMKCHLGSFPDYANIRRTISDLEKEQAQFGRQAKRNDLRQSKGMRAHELRIANLKKELRAHPCHACPDREAHARWSERYFKLLRETEAVLKQIESRTNQVAKTFDRITELLLELGYLTQTADDMESTDDGKRLAKIYGERDLLVSECLRQQIWHQVDPATLAALAAALVYEPRRDDELLHPKMPKGDFGEAFDKTLGIWDELQEISKQYKLPLTNEPDASMALQMQRWASGARLDSILKATGMLAGDFIRWCKQTIDLLEQLSKLKEPKLSSAAESAIDKIKRGIVAYSYYA
ncbi:MAG: DEAD/DEAH box helicase [Acidobacteria bacterium]|nr:DEAD/DEAH box helicase [Acidobacteriota bacterium]